MKNRIVWAVMWAVVGGLIGVIVLGEMGKPDKVEAQKKKGRQSGKHRVFDLGSPVFTSPYGTEAGNHERATRKAEVSYLNKILDKEDCQVAGYNDRFVLVTWP